MLNVTGLRERTAPYTETLIITVAANAKDDDPHGLISALATTARTVSVGVSLSVQAMTSFAVWGRVSSSGGLCIRAFRCHERHRHDR